MKRLYKLTLDVIDIKDKSPVFKDHVSFLAHSTETSLGNIDIQAQLKQMFDGLFNDYLCTENTRLDYWDKQIEICQSRLQEKGVNENRRSCLKELLDRAIKHRAALTQENSNEE